MISAAAFGAIAYGIYEMLKWYDSQEYLHKVLEEMENFGDPDLFIVSTKAYVLVLNEEMYVFIFLGALFILFLACFPSLSFAIFGGVLNVVFMIVSAYVALMYYESDAPFWWVR